MPSNYLHRAIVESCDVYFYNLGKMLGVDRIAAYARAFGLGAPLGIDLPREKGGLIPTKQWKLSRLRQPWQMGETISLSIGQGFNLVTPLGLLLIGVPPWVHYRAALPRVRRRVHAAGL
jgi:penicillin-binding protein 2